MKNKSGKKNENILKVYKTTGKTLQKLRI